MSPLIRTRSNLNSMPGGGANGRGNDSPSSASRSSIRAHLGIRWYIPPNWPPVTLITWPWT